MNDKLKEIKARHEKWEAHGVEYHRNPFIDARLKDWHQDRAELIRMVDNLEQSLQFEKQTCHWCGAIHKRGQNTLCQLTIAEARVAELQAQVDVVRNDIEKWSMNELRSYDALERIQAAIRGKS